MFHLFFVLTLGLHFDKIFFSLFFFLQIRWNKKKASQKMFLHVLNCCCIFYLHLKKSSIILCYPNPIFCHSFLLYSTSCFLCKDQLLLNLFFLFFFFRRDCTGKRQVNFFFFWPLLSRCFICNLRLCLQLSMVIFLNSHIHIITWFHVTLLVFQVMSTIFTFCSIFRTWFIPCMYFWRH